MSCQIEAKIRRVETHIAAFVAMKGPYRLIEGTVRKIIGVTIDKGFTIVGMPVGVFVDLPGEVSKAEQLWEVRFPVDGSAIPGSVDEHGVGIKTVEGYLFAYAVHTGPLTEIGATVDSLRSWIIDNGFEIAGPLQEVYLTDPATATAEELVTEVGFPLANGSTA